MSDQDEALRLADAVAYLQGSLRHGDDEESCPACARYRELIGAAIAMKAENERLRAERDALRKALKAMLATAERHAPTGVIPEPGSPVALARAALAAREETK